MGKELYYRPEELEEMAEKYAVSQDGTMSHWELLVTGDGYPHLSVLFTPPKGGIYKGTIDLRNPKL